VFRFEGPRSDTSRVAQVQERTSRAGVANTLVLDFREYVESDTYEGFTKKGVTFTEAEIPNLKKAIAAAEKEMASRKPKAAKK
jgi:hypothetical protein